MGPCEEANGGAALTASQPTRCRVGNSWPSKGGFCAAADIPFASRANLRKAVEGYDDPTQRPLHDLFSRLASEKGMLLLVGDSVMQQFYGALACELEREQVWKDSSKFTNTDEIRHVEILPSSSSSSSSSAAAATAPFAVPIKFVPIYHFVNGKYDRVANASMHHLRKAVEEAVKGHDSVMILINMGLHYVSNPIAQFTRTDYISQMTNALTYLHNMATSHAPTKRMRILWRETTAQHFPTPDGYWPGVRYAKDMKVGCVPIANPGPESDWRNSDIEHIVKSNGLGKHIKIVPFFNITRPLWSEHVNGHLRDCTHFCWSPMLYQPLFHAMANEMLL